MAIYKSIGNNKPKIYNRYTCKKREKEPNITLKIVIKSQREQKKRKRTKNNYKTRKQ